MSERASMDTIKILKMGFILIAIIGIVYIIFLGFFRFGQTESDFGSRAIIVIIIIAGFVLIVLIAIMTHSKNLPENSALLPKKGKIRPGDYFYTDISANKFMIIKIIKIEPWQTHFLYHYISYNALDFEPTAKNIDTLDTDSVNNWHRITHTFDGFHYLGNRMVYPEEMEQLEKIKP